jgi:hypothetical protein
MNSGRVAEDNPPARALGSPRVEETAAVQLPRSAATMWSFIVDPAPSVELDDSAEAGVVLSGS